MSANGMTNMNLINPSLRSPNGMDLPTFIITTYIGIIAVWSVNRNIQPVGFIIAFALLTFVGFLNLGELPLNPINTSMIMFMWSMVAYAVRYRWNCPVWFPYFMVIVTYLAYIICRQPFVPRDKQIEKMRHHTLVQYTLKLQRSLELLQNERKSAPNAANVTPVSPAIQMTRVTPVGSK